MAIFFLLSLGREAVPRFSCPHHGPAASTEHADGHAAHVAAELHSERPAPEHGANPCSCLDDCLGCSAVVPLRARIAPAGSPTTVDRDVKIPATTVLLPATHPPHFLPFSTPPPPAA